ncbi:MAG: hypothetical protein IJT94_09760, partial [Oscillibacter sp.]|nr:hypothetical protein [Oscillibacter sp.]
MSFNGNSAGRVNAAGYFLESEVGVVRKTRQIAQTMGETLDGGAKVVKAGTIWPATAATAAGIVYEEDDGSGYPDISAPGEAENPDEMPKAGPVSQAIARLIAQTKSYILKDANSIILGAKDEINGQIAEIQVEVDRISEEVDDPENGLSALLEILSERIALSVSEFNTESNRYVDLVLTVDGTECGRGRVLITGNVDVSGELSADALYAAYGDVADLIVNRMKTAQRITKYLLGDTSDDDHQFLFGERHQFISGSYAGGTEQAANPYGAPLYWEDDTAGEGVYVGSDGYPHRQDGTRIFTQTDQTPYPVMQYTYNDLVKMEIAFEGESGPNNSVIQTPTILLGAGNAQGLNKAYIRKGLNGLEIFYLSNTGRNVGFRGTTDGYLDPCGLRRTDALDFTGWSSGFFTERVEGDQNEHGFDVDFDENSRPVRIWDEAGHAMNITWGETDPATEIFLAGVSVGQQLKGWAAVSDFGGGVISGDNWALADFYQWARANGAPSDFADAESYAAYAGITEIDDSGNYSIRVPLIS